jgi:hypothetical protein
MPSLFEYVKGEWEVLKEAPLAFILLLAIGVISGVGIGEWRDSGRMDSLQEQIKERDGQISRYRVALGIDKASQNSLIDLTNEELKVKADNTIGKLRQMYASFQKRSEDLKKQQDANKISERAAADHEIALMREVANEFDATLRSDYLLTENELLRRLDPKATAAVVRIPLFDAATGTPISIFTLAPTAGSFVETGILPMLADEMEQLSKLLPASSH